MYDDNKSPYRCPLCLVRPSLCLVDPFSNKHIVGCMTCSCDAPTFREPEWDIDIPGLEYRPLIEWDRWVVQYRNEHPNWHQEHICKGCLKDWRSCGHYDKNCVKCPDAVYETEEMKE